MPTICSGSLALGIAFSFFHNPNFFRRAFAIAATAMWWKRSKEFFWEEDDDSSAASEYEQEYESDVN